MLISDSLKPTAEVEDLYSCKLDSDKLFLYLRYPVQRLVAESFVAAQLKAALPSSLLIAGNSFSEIVMP